MKYNDFTLGQIEAVLNKLGGPEAVNLFLKGKLVVRVSCDYSSIWKTIKIGTIKTADEFRKAIGERGMEISAWANDILGDPEFVTVARETEVDLVKVSVGELGFKERARIDQIYARAKELGLELCPPEVGPQLRLQYQDQPNKEFIFIGMRPTIYYLGGIPGVFRVGRPGREPRLYSSYDPYNDFVWDAGTQWVDAGTQWVFVRPRI